jgi:hypothetical protein
MVGIKIKNKTNLIKVLSEITRLSTKNKEGKR